MADLVGEYCLPELGECVSLINWVLARSPYTLCHCQVSMRRSLLGFALIAPLSIRLVARAIALLV
ncbi:MAG: hypothetical protein RMZ41_007165 [Nostoc sp. DedVER02]|uniref:hypothetical protein n=1 Tax=unclassified Nostoc TaxID=2593658 RepID=UPI002AD21E72|nr:MULTISPECIES: hypothetical protein [unclassified Nostoc]MDZ7985514.1 hypothetical protein [Nostoc sp. DedVER02]MDZ8116980.1 hypothetical protein [Nostoc sp. DedVER01b]